jgi:hypothetical protein
MPSPTAHKLLNPNIDTYLNPFIPHNPVKHLPTPISHFLGYRSKPAKEPPVLVQWVLTFFATVAGICVVGAVYNYAPALVSIQTPTLIASLGASAVLDYNTIKSPLAQPRNSIVGHTVSAIVGTGIAKAFLHSPDFFAKYAWVAAAIACALSSLAMSMTNTVHPPGGATAIIACTEAAVVRMGWYFPAIMLLASTLMVAVALVFNNICRQYPVFWWTPEDVGSKLPFYRKGTNEPDRKKENDEEKQAAEHEEGESDFEKTLEREMSDEVEFEEALQEVQILPYKVRLPEGIRLTDEEVEALKQLQARIRMHSEVN